MNASTPNKRFIPQSFLEGQPIEQIILVVDVDGVVRESIESKADSRVTDALKALMKNQVVDVAFVSGTPVDIDRSLEPWRQANLPLNKVFEDLFHDELTARKVTIYGVLGGQKIGESGQLETLEEYSQEMAFELGSLLVHAFLLEVLTYGNPAQQQLARDLQQELNTLSLVDRHQPSHTTHREFHKIALMIREHLDPHFRLISNGALVETHTSNPPWSTSLSSDWLKHEMRQKQYLVSSLHSSERQISAGFGKRGDLGFNYLMVSKTDKGRTTKQHLEEKRKHYPNALIIAIGDGKIDFPMYEHAHLAFHVGLKEIWEKYHQPHHCILVCSQKGEDSQHVEGTLRILQFLEHIIGKSFYDVNFNTEFG